MSRRLSVLLPNGRRFHTFEELTVSVVKKRAAELLLLSAEDARLFGLAEVDASGQIHWLKEEQHLTGNHTTTIHYKIRYSLRSLYKIA